MNYADCFSFIFIACHFFPPLNNLLVRTANGRWRCIGFKFVLCSWDTEEQHFQKSRHNANVCTRGKSAGTSLTESHTPVTSVSITWRINLLKLSRANFCTRNCIRVHYCARMIFKYRMGTIVRSILCEWASTYA